MGDFTGFSFGDWHSSNPENGEVIVLRVSGGDRYEEELHPEISDRTAEVPGLNGQYYFGSDYGTKTIDIEFAFDHLTEKEFRRLRQVFGTKRVQELIFDERPYKYYMAKIENPIELSYVCFDEPKTHVVGTAVGDERYGVRVVNRTTTTDEETGDVITTIERERIYPYERLEGTERIYKGEGKVTFICYFPFAKSRFKELSFHFQLTTDTEIGQNKKYFIFNDESQKFERVETPDVEDIGTYFERVDDESTQDWAFSSGILSVNDYEEFDTYDSQTGIIKIYNAGDVATGFRLYIPAPNGSIGAMTLTYKADGTNVTDSLMLEAMTLKDNEEGILIDTYNELIVGVLAPPGIDASSGKYIYTTSGNLYNQHITAGYCFKLEPNDNKDNYSTLEITGGVNNMIIFYDYLYF